MRRLLPAFLAIVAIVVSGALVSHAGTTFSGGGGGVATTRAINTTSPVAGGGDLSADRTLTFSNTYVDPSINGFRVSLTSLTPVTTADVASGTALYLCTYTSDRMSIWDGSEWDVLTVTDEPVVYLTGLTADTNYDVFTMSSAGSVTIDATLVAWTNATTRAVTLDEQDGVRTKGGDRTRRWVATIRATGATATEDQEIARYLFNASNRVVRYGRIQETTSHNYSTATWRVWNADSTTRIELVLGESTPVMAVIMAALRTDTSGQAAMCATDLDTVNVAGSAAVDSIVSLSSVSTGYSYFGGYTTIYVPGVGRHFVIAGQLGAGTGVQAFGAVSMVVALEN